MLTQEALANLAKYKRAVVLADQNYQAVEEAETKFMQAVRDSRTARSILRPQLDEHLDCLKELHHLCTMHSADETSQSDMTDIYIKLAARWAALESDVQMFKDSALFSDSHYAHIKNTLSHPGEKILSLGEQERRIQEGCRVWKGDFTSNF